MSTRNHPKNVNEKSPKKRNSSGQKCPRKFVKSVHENSPILSTKFRLLCSLEFCHLCVRRRMFLQKGFLPILQCLPYSSMYIWSRFCICNRSLHVICACVCTNKGIRDNSSETRFKLIMGWKQLWSSIFILISSVFICLFVQNEHQEKNMLC